MTTERDVTIGDWYVMAVGDIWECDEESRSGMRTYIAMERSRARKDVDLVDRSGMWTVRKTS